MNILITGFEPFASLNVNPSEFVAKELANKLNGIPKINAQYFILPTAFQVAGQELDQLLKNHVPDLILLLGVSENSKEINLERVALNLLDARIPDNVGLQPRDMPAVNDGPPAYISHLPLQTIVDELKGAGYPARVSNYAGTYLCNFAYYKVRHYLASRSVATPALFVHLPMPSGFPEQEAPEALYYKQDLVNALYLVSSELAMIGKRNRVPEWA